MRHSFEGNYLSMTNRKQIALSLIFLWVCCPASVCLAAVLYTEELKPVIVELRNDNPVLALEIADALVRQTIDSGKKKQDKYLVLLERGKIALAAGKYDQCIADLQEAEQRFLAIEGTISLTEGFGSLLTDDTVQEYEAEMHEKIMISPYLALAYLGKGDFAGAVVERNRTMNKIHQYIDAAPDERSYLENPFARLVSAIIYEMENKPDDARIEYKKMYWDEEAARLEQKKTSSTDLVILIDTGLAPHKYQIKWGPLPVVVKDTTIHLGFAYAAYQPTDSIASGSTVSIDGTSLGSARLVYDLEKTVLSQYEKNKPVLMSKLIARMTSKAAVQVSAHAAADKIAKDNPLAGFLLKSFAVIVSAVWVAVEKADLRGWMTLPQKISYLRIDNLTPGEHTIIVDYGSGQQQKKIVLEENKINLAHFSFAK